jgi:hypothetical protein
MAAEIRFRVILPVAEGLSATLFGGFRLWERSAFLCRPVFGNETLWNSSVAAHYWPWTYKFIAVLNFPALLAGLLLGWPIGRSGQVCLSLRCWFIVLLWFRIGCWFDHRWGWMDGPPSQ